MSQGFHLNIPIPTSLPPNGAAGGDLSGNYPAPNVVKLQGRSVAAIMPTDRQMLRWDNTTQQWQPRYDNVRVITASGPIALSDDKLIINNAATGVTLQLPSTGTANGKRISISRAPNSTGTIVVWPTGSGQIQNLNGGFGASTAIGLHSGTGGGVGHEFWCDGVNWYR